MNKKVLIGGIGAVSAVVVAGIVAALVYRMKTIKAGDTVSIDFAAAVADATICAKAGDALTLSGKVDSVDTAAKTAKVAWNTLTNLKASDKAAVTDAACTAGTSVSLKSSDKSSDAAWLALWFGAAGVAPTQAVYGGKVPAILSLSALKKKMAL